MSRAISDFHFISCDMEEIAFDDSVTREMSRWPVEHTLEFFGGQTLL